MIVPSEGDWHSLLFNLSDYSKMLTARADRSSGCQGIPR